MQSSGSPEKEFVLVEHEFEYTSKEGRVVTIKPNERYVLLKRTNEHWWHVCLDNKTKPFYIPAKYVRVLPSTSGACDEHQPARHQAEIPKESVLCPQYSYAFLPPEEHFGTSQASNPMPTIAHLERIIAGNTLPGISTAQQTNSSSALLVAAPKQVSAKDSLPTSGVSATSILPTVPKQVSPTSTLPTVPKQVSPTSTMPTHPKQVSATSTLPTAPKQVSATSTLPTVPKQVSATSTLLTAPKQVNATSTLPTNPKEVGATSTLPTNPKQISVTSTLPTVPKQVNATSTLPTNPKEVGANNTLPTSGVQRAFATKTLPEADNTLPIASNIMPPAGNTLPAVVVHRVGAHSTMPGAKANRVSFLSVSDDSVVFVQPAEDRAEGSSMLRTFHNSKKILNPNKRISFLCSVEPQTLLRATQSLNDLEKIVYKTPVLDNQQPESAQDGRDRLVATESSQMAPQEAAKTPDQEVKEEEELVPVYVNIEELRKDGLRRRSQQHSSTSTLEEWETHTDASTGQLFYYNSLTGETTWDSPFDPSEDQALSPISSPSQSPLPVDSDWVKHFDDITRQFYYYNSISGESSWDPPPEEELDYPGVTPVYPSDRPMEKRPPTPEADYPDYLPNVTNSYPEVDYSKYQLPPVPSTTDDRNYGWYSQINNDGRALYTDNGNNETWLPSDEPIGKPHFYVTDGAVSQWSLPQINRTIDPYRTQSESDSDTNSVGSWNTVHKPAETKNLEKAGVLHKTKIAEHGKKLRKSWSSSWTVLEGGILTFFKDGKNLSSNSLKATSSLTTPEHTVNLQGATLGWAKKDKSSKKNVLELKTADGSEYLIHHDSESITADWFATLNKSISRNTAEHFHEYEVDTFLDMGSNEKLGIKEEKEKKLPGQSSTSVTSEDSRNVRAKLKKLLQRRPTLQSLRDQGYIKDQVFGCHLQQLCEREKHDVPGFVTKAIQAVERRGLDIDGLYRISGNLAVIQKLRYKVDHDENFSLEDGRWEDVHVITGALKLFFRELPEPLFPYSHFDGFIEAIKIPDSNQKSRRIKELVESLPTPNLETIRVLFRHLCRVIEFRESNRMSVQSVAIVFGPTLLRPETEGISIAVHMVFQSQIVEQILMQYKYIFNIS